MNNSFSLNSYRSSLLRLNGTHDNGTTNHETITSNNTLEPGGSNQGVNIPLLMHKLCKHFAKDDAELSTKFFQMASHFLTLSTQTQYHMADSDIVLQVQKHLLKTQSPEKAKSFEMLHAKLQNTTAVQNKTQFLTFLLKLSGSGSKECINWMSTVPRHKNVMSNAGSSQLNFLPDDPRTGVRKIYQSPLSRKTSSVSYKTNLQSTVTNSDQDFLDNQRSSATFTSVSNNQIIQEVIYSFQGIEGRVIRKELNDLGFYVDAKYAKSITPVQQGLVERLLSIGFLHNQLKARCDEADKQIGLIGQALIAILREELTNYYQLVALLQAQSKDLTLRRMVVWVAETQSHLQWLAHIAECCSEKKGGALISAVHGFLQHGSLCVQKVSEKVLSAVCRPLYLMLSKWLLDGELNDPCGEFFIEARSINAVERLWHDKYHVRKAMIPSFINLDQSNKILAIGKSINFLRQVCKDAEVLPGREHLEKLFSNPLGVDALFSPERSIELHTALDNVYKETSLRVLDLLKNKYRLMEHLHALRRYLLLGQGDFIGHLLELLAPELSKPAHALYGHTLTAILESAIRVTTAQYEDEDILKLLSISLLVDSRDDTGWDVFTLVYLVDGPVGTILQPTVYLYKRLFGGLWKAKRMEFVLSNMRKQQISSNKLYKSIQQMRPVTHAIHILASQMIHFLHQMQYYFLSEVLECSWAEMLRQVNQAICLDDVIKAHNTFLNSVECGVLLDSTSDNLRLQLILIFKKMLDLETSQNQLYEMAAKAKQDLLAYQQLRDLEGFGVNMEKEAEFKKKMSEFNQYLNTSKVHIQHLSLTFRKYVEIFVHLLATSADMNLQLLATRLNFNDYYKKK